MFRVFACVTMLTMLLGLVPAVQAQPIVKAPIQVDAGNTKQTGATFGYRLTYNCSSTSGPCLNAEVVDLLPIEVQELSTVPASPTGDVAAINVTPNFGGSGRTRVQFVLINPLPAGNSGDLIINVRFPNGSTPDGTIATNTVDAINLGASPGTFTSPPVTVTAVATTQATLEKTLTTSPANLDGLDGPETYRLRIANPNANGALNLTAIGPVTDTLPPGTMFTGATPAADCEPGCVGTTPATVTWTSPCSVPLAPNANCDIAVNVAFPSGTFPSGTSATNSFAADVTPLGESPQSLAAGQVTHPVTTFVASPGATFSKNMFGSTPNPPTLNQTFAYDLNVANAGNVPLDNMVVIDTLPVEMQLNSITTGAYSGLSDFAAGEGVRASYEKNTALGVFTLWGSSPNTTTNTSLTAPPPGLGAGEYITRIRWEYGQAQVGMTATTRPLISGQIVNPDNAGGPVAFGDTIQNCAALSAVYTAGPTNVNQNDCESFTLSGPFVQLNPSKENLSGGGPFNPGQAVSFRLRVRSDSRSSDPAPLEDIVVTDLLPVDLLNPSWAFDDQSTGLPAPQVFDQIPNFAGTGRTLLRWRWNAGSGSLGVNQQIWIGLNTTIRNGAVAGSLTNDLTLDLDAPGLGQRCSGASQADALDLDEDADTAETLCRESESVSVASIAQLVSAKRIAAVCGQPMLVSFADVPAGCAVEYSIAIQNVGTVPMTNLTVIDILPYVGDSNVRDGNPRGSAWNVALTEPVIAPPGAVVSYSTSGYPCRGEVGGPTVGCDPPNWTTVIPSPISSVRSVKIEYGDRTVQPFDLLTTSIFVTTPANAPAGSIAYNSFAYNAERADGLGSLAAEPVKTPLTAVAASGASIGDFVWVDTNGDGIQNDGATGLNDVTVRLYSPGVDGLLRSPDDQLLATTLTAASPTAEAGWYAFPGLLADTYYVCVEPPATYTFAPAGSGGSTDSDANPASGCTAAIVLATNQLTADIDFGLIATGLGALTGYAWLDRNNDGIQNETPLDGLNGVTVQLFEDDGDTTPNPNVDLVVASTQTADDATGRPGYYSFDGLDPTATYFVRFITPASVTGFTSADAGGDDSVDSDADTTTGLTSIVALSPGATQALDAGFVAATGTLAIGDQVWSESDNDGIFEPENGELGIDGVRLDLYLDSSGDGVPNPDEFLASTVSETRAGFSGRYGFDGLAPGNYIIAIPISNFAGSAALEGLVSSTGNDPAPDPDDDVNGDDNGVQSIGYTFSQPVTLTDNGEPTSEDGNNDTNLTVDFGFIPAGSVDLPQYDFGDAPDAGAGTGPFNYNTTIFDAGAAHLIDTPGSPFLGTCVDADTGTAHNPSATADDISTGVTVGNCVGDDDEDGVSIPTQLLVDQSYSFQINRGSGASCLLNAWIDWNHDGFFGAGTAEQISSDLALAFGINPLIVAVPADATPGATYARFRCSTSSGLGPTGIAADGEVEDYVVSVVNDTEAPVTTASAVTNSTPYTFGAWSRYDVQITLTATDDNGVAATYYSIDDPACDEPLDAGCIPYTAPFTISAEGQHTIRFFSTDEAGNVEAVQSVVVAIDKTAPLLDVPDDITVDPDGPSGTVVTFSATATDNLDLAPVVACIPPSGSTFPVGTTLVTCTATDHAGNQTSASFNVTVRGVSDLFAALRAQIQSTNTGSEQKRQMLTHVTLAEGMVAAGQPQFACTQMNLLDLYIRSQVSRRRVTQSDANLLYARTADIRTALGCGTN